MYDWFVTLWQRAIEIWLKGGPAMIAIAVIALIMFGMGVHVALRLREKRFMSVPERVWRRWIDHPNERTGPIGHLLDIGTSGGKSLEDASHFFHELRTTEAAPFERDLRVMKVCVATAPLVGLLGTVTGMLTTFGAIAHGSGGDQTMGMIASGISEALVTTMTGLVIALPGLFFQYQLARRYEMYKSFLAHLETVCTQVLYRDHRVARERAVREAAAARVAEALRAAVS